MPSLAITSNQHSTHQAQHQIDRDLPPASEKSSHQVLDDIGSSTAFEHYSETTSPQRPDPATATPDREWKAGKEEWMIILVITTISLMVALDATILVSALPVGAS